MDAPEAAADADALEIDFNAAVAQVRALPKDGPLRVSNGMRLQFYALFKQATEGDVKGTQPWALQLEARAKWDAWNARKGSPPAACKRAYVELLAASATEFGLEWAPPSRGGSVEPRAE